MRKILFISWAIFAIIYVFFIDSISAEYKMLFKLIPMLIVLAIAVTTRTEARRYYWLVVIGLTFCTIGDYTLQWFIVGLSSFLIGHLFYIAAFSSTDVQSTPKPVKIGLIVYGALMLGWFGSTLLGRGEVVLAIAVALYIVVICTMGWTSFRPYARFAVIGAALFILSDSILAANRFIVDVPFAHELIMATYYGAQIFIALSISQYSEIRNKVLQYRHL